MYFHGNTLRQTQTHIFHIFGKLQVITGRGKITLVCCLLTKCQKYVSVRARLCASGKKWRQKERNKERLPSGCPVTTHPHTPVCLEMTHPWPPSLTSVLTVTAAPSQHKNNKLQSYKPQFKKLASSLSWKWLQTSSLTIQMIQWADLLLSLNTVTFCSNYKQQFLPVCKN